ncbi:MAG: GtrA family protein [Candidatus Dactylopiibacterium sp.]|nr:GtrA family protein [Candidatus Dactylopiibacterium sp.]
MTRAGYGQFARYLVVGVLNTLIGYGLIFTFMYVFDLSPELSNLLGYVMGMLFSFFMNKKFTFRSDKGVSEEFLRFFVVFVVAYLANLAMLVLLVRGLEFHPGVSQIVSCGVYFVSSFLMNKYFVFFDRPERGS